jgi:hypothetical protein
VVAVDFVAGCSQMKLTPETARVYVSASLDCRSENVRVLQVVIAELELCNTELRNTLYGVQFLEGDGCHEEIGNSGTGQPCQATG